MKRQTKPVRHIESPVYVSGSGYIGVSAYSTNSLSAPVTMTGAVREESPAEKIARLEATVKGLQAEIRKMKAKRRKA